MPIEPRNQSFIDSDGSLQTYSDPYGNVKQEDVDKAIFFENKVRQALGAIQAAYIAAGQALDVIEAERLYLARGYPTFKDWLRSPEIGISYRLAHDLIRIVREALPVLMNRNAMDLLPNVSIMRSLLPVLESGEDQFIAAAQAVQGKTVEDAHREIARIQGRADDTDPFIKGFIRTYNDVHTIKFIYYTTQETFDLGELRLTTEQLREFRRVFRGELEQR